MLHDVVMANSKKLFKLLDRYTFSGFRPMSHILGVFGDRMARVITFIRTQKKQSVVNVVLRRRVGMTGASGEFATCPVQIRVSILSSRFDAWIAKAAAL